MRAIKDETLGEVRTLIERAKNNRVDKIAPQSFKLAQNKLSEADAFITQHPYEKEMMHQKANEALFMSQRLFQIADQSEKFKDMKPEETTLWMEKILYEITAKLAATDMRNQPYKIQVENIVGSIDALQKDRQFMFDKVKTLQSEIETKNSQIADLEGKTREQQIVKERLAAEKRFNELFMEVQNLFSPDEAEVYKKGDSLVIRLRAIQFPVGKSVIMPDNYPLISKIQQSIRTFGEPDVTIEGHTDSTGSNELNELLSQQRAESVRQYLLANKTLSYDRIVAVGYGSSKPLASNETEEGRAVNRRIDVIIKPQAQSGGN
jgi:OOP family OmpA-OmpF porin